MLSERRQIAERIVYEWANAHQITEVGPDTMAQLSRAIESALKDRDDRAVKIAARVAAELSERAYVGQEPASTTKAEG